MSNLDYLKSLPELLRPQSMAEQMAGKWNSHFKNKNEKRIDALGLIGVAETLFGLMTQDSCREKCIRNAGGTPVVEFRVSAQKSDNASLILKALGFSVQTYRDPDDQFVAYTFEGKESVAQFFALSSLILSNENQLFSPFFGYYPLLQSEEEKIREAFAFLNKTDIDTVSRGLGARLEKGQSLESLANQAFSGEGIELIPSISGDKCVTLYFPTLKTRNAAQTELSKLDICRPPRTDVGYIANMPSYPLDISGEDGIAKLLALATHATDQKAIENASPLLKISGLSIDRQSASPHPVRVFANIPNP